MRRQGRHAGGPLVLQIHQAPTRHPACIDKCDILRQRIFAERRIHEDDVEGLRHSPKIARRSHLHDVGLGESIQLLQLRLEVARGELRLLDEYDVPSSPRQRLEPQSTRSGKQIQATSIGYRVLQPV